MGNRKFTQETAPSLYVEAQEINYAYRSFGFRRRQSVTT
jgi:hypothetical protein